MVSFPWTYSDQSCLTIDFETRSSVDLKKAGAWKYAEDPSTEIICLAIKHGSGISQLWLPDKFREQVEFFFSEDTFLEVDNPAVGNYINWLIKDRKVTEAHNAEFERAIWHHIMHKRYGFDDLPLNKMRCSAAKAAMHSLPRQLEKACSALGLEEQKDTEGHKLMLKMCKPRKPRKDEMEKMESEGYQFYQTESGHWAHTKEIIITSDHIEKHNFTWHEEPEDIARLCEYCLQDVEAEHALSKALRNLPPSEQNLWFVDQKINQRGIQVDSHSVKEIIKSIKVHEGNLIKEFKEIVPTAESPRQVEETRTWVNNRMPEGAELENLQKQTVIDTLERDDISDSVRRVLELRQSLGKSSTAKYNTLLKMLCEDGRIRGLFMYHGAGTGRWSGKGFQPQNLPSRGVFSDVEPAIDMLVNQEFDELDLLYGDLMYCASVCLRPMLVAAKGHDFICADYSSIEGRGTAWLAGAMKILKAFADGLDLYKVAAQDIFNIEYDGVDKDQRQVGKVSELALGYGGGISAYASMADGYGIDLETLPAFIFPRANAEEKDKAASMAKNYIKQNPDKMSIRAAAACDIIKQKWRAKRPEIVQLWYGLEEAAVGAVANPGKTFSSHGVRYAMRGKFLCCRLPSGRVLFYYDPRIIEKKTPWGAMKPVVTYMNVDATTKKWVRTHTYGGKLTENVVQAMCRDLLSDAMVRLEGAGYPVVLHVHDEAMSEVKEGFGSVEEYCKIMEELPDWAKGLPVKAEGWRGKRYRK